VYLAEMMVFLQGNATGRQIGYCNIASDALPGLQIGYRWPIDKGWCYVVEINCCRVSVRGKEQEHSESALFKGTGTCEEGLFEHPAKADLYPFSRRREASRAFF
jgi:hypothetical protein